jgi:hypothetical protein
MLKGTAVTEGHLWHPAVGQPAVTKCLSNKHRYSPYQLGTETLLHSQAGIIDLEVILDEVCPRIRLQRGVS